MITEASLAECFHSDRPAKYETITEAIITVGSGQKNDDDIQSGLSGYFIRRFLVAIQPNVMTATSCGNRMILFVMSVSWRSPLCLSK